MITIDNIEMLIPQRPPFVMIDKLLSFSETATITGFSIKADNIFVENGVPVEFNQPLLVIE